MRFIKCILCECFPVSPYFFQLVFRVSLTGSTFNKTHFHLIQHGPLFLTHRFAQYVCIALTVPRQFLRQQHHLFLVYGDAIGFFQVFLHVGQVVTHYFLSVLAGHKLWYIRHGAGAVQRIHGNQVVEFIRFQFTQVFLHAGAFKLECGIGISLLV